MRIRFVALLNTVSLWLQDHLGDARQTLFHSPRLHPAAYNFRKRKRKSTPRLTGRLSVRLVKLTARKFAGGLRACCPSVNMCQRDEACLMTHSSCGYFARSVCSHIVAAPWCFALH